MVGLGCLNREGCCKSMGCKVGYVCQACVVVVWVCELWGMLGARWGVHGTIN